MGEWVAWTLIYRSSQPARGFSPSSTHSSRRKIMPVSEKIVLRRFGRFHDKPCDNPNTLTCAMPECQIANRCALARLREERKGK
jgi:hypothetical protein